MIVSVDTFNQAFENLKIKPVLSFDTETTGLYPYKGDRLFSLIIYTGDNITYLDSTTEDEVYYFNFNVMDGIPKENILRPSHLKRLGEIFADPSKFWFAHNAKFDMHMLGVEGIEIAGKIHCTMNTARLIYNVHDSYSLASCAERIGFKKDDAVEKYIDEHHLWDWQEIPGVKTRNKLKFYHRVPFDIIAPYGCTDAVVTYKLGQWQLNELHRLSGPTGVREPDSPLPSVWNVYENECSLLKVVYNMEKSGIHVDKNFCHDAIKFNLAEQVKYLSKIEKIYGAKYIDSEKHNCILFADQKDKWEKSDKGRWSFKSKIIEYFDSPAAEYLRKYRQARYNGQFFHQTLWFMDTNCLLHPNMQQGGTDTGRFACNSPNVQNQKNDEEADPNDPGYPYRPRKAAIVPSSDYEIVSLDYKSQEFYMALSYGRETELIARIKDGMDPHMATAYTMGLCAETDKKEVQKKARKHAKTINFGLIFGAGNKKLGFMLGVAYDEAVRLKELYFSKLNGLTSFSEMCKGRAKKRGFIINKMGRILYYPRRFSKKKKEIIETSYKATNGIIQSSCADITKISMVRVYELLKNTKSRMFISLHDEIDLYLHKDDRHLLPRIKEIMESVLTGDIISMETSVAVSNSNWGDCV